MKSLFFSDRAFSYEALRAAAYAPYDGADIGEVLATTERIEEGDWDGWHDAWFATAARVEQAAESARAAGHLESARAAYLRASNYYRTAEHGHGKVGECAPGDSVLWSRVDLTGRARLR